MLPRLTEQLTSQADLSAVDIAHACERLLDENEPVTTRADFLRALHRKGETPAEIADFVRVLLERARVPAITENGLIDVCGTGGDRLGLLNISTASMFVVAACGGRVVKHGNRGITSKSGGADVLEALGVRIDTAPERAGEILEAVGCLFLFAPLYHPTFKAIAPVRQTLAAEGTPSIFNILGPLLNPARPDYQLAGVFNEKLLPTYAETFRLLGRRRAWAVHGRAEDFGVDEVSTLGPTKVHAWEDGAMVELEIQPEMLGLHPSSLEHLRGGTAAENAGLIESILAGELKGPKSDIVALNAAAALVVIGRFPDVPTAFQHTREALEHGAAREVLRRLRAAA